MRDINIPEGSALKSLLAGYRRFKQSHIEASESFSKLVTEGQKPKILVIACCDSRVDPAIVTGCAPGDLFVVRNIANLVPPFESDRLHHGTSAALEFGVLHLGVTDIVIAGHSHCGGIRALVERDESSEDNTDFIHNWMSIGATAKQQVLAEYGGEDMDCKAQHCEKASLKVSLDNLNTFPWIAERMQAGKLFCHACYFNMSAGHIELYQAETDSFVPVE